MSLFERRSLKIRKTTLVSLMPRPLLSGYFLIRNFFYPASAAYECATFGPALQSRNFWIRYESGIVLMLNPDILLRTTKGARQLYLVVGTLLTVEENFSQVCPHSWNSRVVPTNMHDMWPRRPWC